MVDNEMIERCKEAIDNFPHWDFNNLEREQLALAVITAMREPTEKMLKAGHDVMTDYDDSKVCWEAMIYSITND